MTRALRFCKVGELRPWEAGVQAGLSLAMPEPQLHPDRGDTHTDLGNHSAGAGTCSHRMTSVFSKPNDITPKQLSASQLLLVKLDKSRFGQVILCVFLISCPVSWHWKRPGLGSSLQDGLRSRGS